MAHTINRGFPPGVKGYGNIKVVGVCTKKRGPGELLTAHSGATAHADHVSSSAGCDDRAWVNPTQTARQTADCSVSGRRRLFFSNSRPESPRLRRCVSRPVACGR